MLPNGDGVLLKVDVSSTATIIGSQRDFNMEESNDVIDVSSKDDGRFAAFLTGRYNASISMDGIYVPGDSALAELRIKVRDGTEIIITRAEDTVEIEEASAIVERMSIDAADQEASIVSVDLRITGSWTSLP